MKYVILLNIMYKFVPIKCTVLYFWNVISAILNFVLNYYWYLPDGTINQYIFYSNHMMQPSLKSGTEPAPECFFFINNSLNIDFSDYNVSATFYICYTKSIHIATNYFSVTNTKVQRLNRCITFSAYIAIWWMCGEFQCKYETLKRDRNKSHWF